MTDQPQWHPKAALAALLFMSVLFAAAGLANIFGIANIELSFFGHFVSSPLGNVLWIVISLLFAAVFAYLLKRVRSKK